MASAIHRPWFASLVAAVVGFSAVGCASKGYVRNTVSPIETRVGEVETRSADNSTKIENLEEEVEKSVSRLDERTVAADQKAQEAGERAANARERADEAHDLAAKGLTRADGLEQSLHHVVEGMDNYQLAWSETVLFGFNSSQLSDEAMAQLDTLAAKIDGLKRYVIEVRGFTDSTGPAQYNLELSQQRAEAVVRYLTVVKEIPLHRVHVLGAGSENPVSDNSTLEGRKENRRVELRLFQADIQRTELTGHGSGAVANSF